MNFDSARALAGLVCCAFLAQAAAQSGPSADLEVAFVDPPIFVELDSVAAFALRVRNVGPDPAASPRVYISYPIFTPDGTVDAPPGWTCTHPPPPPPVIPPAAWAYECVASSIEPGVAHFVFRIPINFGLGYRFDLGAGVQSPTPDPELSNYSAAVRIIAGEPQQTDLAVHVEEPRLPVRNGEELRWVLDVSNSGPDAAHSFDVYFADRVPNGYTVSTPPGWSCPRSVSPNGINATFRCSTASMAPGSSARFLVTRLAQERGLHRLLVFLSAAPADLIEANNLDEAHAWVTGGGPESAELGIEVVAAAVPGQFEVRITNRGPATAGEAFVSLDVPRGNVPQAAFAPGWACRVAGSPAGDRTSYYCNREQLVVGTQPLFFTFPHAVSPGSVRVRLTSRANETDLADNAVDISFGPSGGNALPVPAFIPVGLLLLTAGLAGTGLMARRRRSRVC